jgi:hypothetical protein
MSWVVLKDVGKDRFQLHVKSKVLLQSECWDYCVTWQEDRKGRTESYRKEEGIEAEKERGEWRKKEQWREDEGQEERRNGVNGRKGIRNHFYCRQFLLNHAEISNKAPVETYRSGPLETLKCAFLLCISRLFRFLPKYLRLYIIYVLTFLRVVGKIAV